jgi:tetratricopeptide (TPR) repeat protein
MPLFGPPNVNKLEDKRDIKGLIKALRHRDASVRRDAVEALGRVGDGSIISHLIPAREDINVEVCEAANKALSEVTAREKALELYREGYNQYVAMSAFSVPGPTSGLSEAINCLRKSLELYPEYGPSLLRLGQCHEAIGEFDEALRCYSMALDAHGMDETYNKWAKECHSDLLTKLTGFE